ncbi:MAG: glutamate--tRNA ligase [Pseudomonadota bacterium]
MTIVTRFAPSPTGMLHIGGARTALFNALLARRYNGQFLLRVEDTDKARFTDEATEAILDGLSWLGLSPDATPVFQSANAPRHVACAEAMIANGTAFRCYATPEELAARRETGEAKRKTAKNESLTPDERAALLKEAQALLAPFRSPWRIGGEPPKPEAPFTIRLRAPDSGDIVLDDGVQGRVQIQASEIDDLILLRADGTPTYMLAVVVDDHDMGVTQVLRGDDHLRNTFRQLPIYAALGWAPPKFAHVPLIHGADGAKLSKRHGALSTLAYRDMGYLPEALCAYLLRLGWSHGDQETFTMDEAASLFAIEGLNKAPSRLDLEKLGHVNAHFIRLADKPRLLQLLIPIIGKQTPVDSVLEQRLEAAIDTLRNRGSTLLEIAEACRFLWDSNWDNLNKKARKALRDEGLDLLAQIREALDQSENWVKEGLQDVLAAFCAAHTLSMGQVGPPLRAALTGGLPAPDLAPVMEWLGREEVLARIDQHVSARPAKTE